MMVITLDEVRLNLRLNRRASERGRGGIWRCYFHIPQEAA